MEALEATMKKHNMNIDSSSSNSSSHEHALSSSGFPFNATSTFSSYSNEWLIDFGAFYQMGKDKAIFSTVNECNTKKILVCDDKSLSVTRFGTIQLDDDVFNDVLCVPSLSNKSLSKYQITHSSEEKTIEFSSHQVRLYKLAGCTNLTTLGHHLFH
jgi:hypothetical protein